MKRASIVFLLLILAACALRSESARPKVLVVVRGSQVLPAAWKEFEAKYGKSACDCVITQEEETTPAEVAQAQAIFLQHPSAGFLARTKDAGLAAMQQGAKVATDVPELVSRGWGVEPSMPLTARLMPYWNNGGVRNLRAFLTLLYLAAGGPKETPVPALEEVARMGVYHPDAPRTFASLKEYLAWYRQAKPHQGALVTVDFYYTYLKDRNTAVVDALLRELERQGLAAAGVFGSPHAALRPVFNQPAADPVRVMLMLSLSMAVRPEDRAYLEEQKIHLINLLTTRQSRAEWEAAERGVAPDRINIMLSQPEMAGATEPILVSASEIDPKSGLNVNVPIAERVQAAALRARRWVALTEKPDAQKKIVILYYNNPPGKGNLGASYLNLPPSLRAVVQTLREAGYVTGGKLPSTEELLDLLGKSGRNIENWSPGELDAMVRAGKATLVPVRTYEKWLRETPASFQRAVNARWGRPADAKLMSWKNAAGEKFFVIPGIRLGNLFVGPQLLRSSFEEYTAAQHSSTLPPHHGYVAAYLWYRHAFGADAVIHMGRHGTLEWLPGKNAGQAGWDASEVILGDLPNVNYYIMDGGGEAVQARRRSAAVLISHLTPILARAGLEPRFEPLNDLIGQWQQTRETAPALAKEYESKSMAELERLGVVKQLALDPAKPEECMEKAAQFLETVEEAPLPLGLPTLGEMPSEERQRAGLMAFLGNGFLPDEKTYAGQFLTGWSDAILSGLAPEIPTILPAKVRVKSQRAIAEARQWLDDLRRSPGLELSQLLRVLRGEFLPSGPVGDPLGVPGALPSGRNLHQDDPARLPTRAAWELGRKMGDRLLASYKQAHGSYPERISMILWQGESGRTQGAMEAEAMYLMGVRPEWNGRGVVDRLSLIPDAELGHPRVDVLFTASGLYRDGMADKIVLLDRASRLAASAGKNAISRQSEEVAQALMAGGMEATQARELAGARVFASAPGSFGFGLSNMVEQSRDKDEPKTMAALYLNRMNFAYTEKNWGVSAPKLLERQLKGNQAIVQSRSSNLYGTVDNDDVYQYMGGLRIASATTGAKPDLLINNLRRAGQEKIQGAREFIAGELNARNWNPQWIAEMQKEGYAGARTMMKATENLYGWQATAPEAVAPEVWKKMYDVYVADEYKLGLRKFMEQANPAARQAMLGRLIEVDRQGVYRFTADERRQMVQEYVRSMVRHGAECTANTCGNPKLARYVSAEAKKMLPPSEVKRYESRYSQATHAAPRQTQAGADLEKPSFTLPSSIGRYKVTYMDAVRVVQSYQRLAVEHARALLVFAGVWILSGVGLGFARRRWSRYTCIQLLSGKE